MLSTGEIFPEGSRRGSDGTLDCALWDWGRASGGRMETFRDNVPLDVLRVPAIMKEDELVGAK